MRPGVTSPASVLWRDEESQLNGRPLMETYVEAILPSKLRLDQLYVRNRSIWLDLDVLFWTALVVLPRLGADKPPEDALFAGFFSRLLRRLAGWYARRRPDHPVCHGGHRPGLALARPAQRRLADFDLPGAGFFPPVQPVRAVVRRPIASSGRKPPDAI